MTKTTHNSFTKSLAVFVAAVMVLSCWVFTPLAPKASAAAGSYTLVLNYTIDNAPGGDAYLKVNVTYKTNNGTGSETSTGEKSIATNSSPVTLTINGWPTKVSWKAKGQWNDIYKGHFTSATVNGASAWSGNSGWDSGGGITAYEKSGSFDLSATAPYMSSLTISGTASHTIPKTGASNLTSQYSVSAAYDQYGVQWYTEPTSTFWINASQPSNASEAAHDTATGCSISSSGNLTVTSSAQIAGTTNTKTVYVSCVNGSAWGTKAVTLTDPKYSVKFYDGNGTQVGSTQSIYYGCAATKPSSNPTKNADADYHYTFSSWDDYTNITNDTDINSNYVSNPHNLQWQAIDDNNCKQSCSYCGYVKVASQAHDFGSWSYSSATQHKHVCSRCGKEVYANHNPSSTWSTNTTQHWKVCTDCGQVIGSKENHTGGVPTCTQQGNCSVCGVSYGSLDVDNHDWDYANAVFNWNGYDCTTATVKCSRNDSHTKTVETTVTSEITREATAEQPGIRTYTATFTVGSTEYTATKTAPRYWVEFVNYDGTVLQEQGYDVNAVPSYTGANPTKPATAQYSYTWDERDGWEPAVTAVSGNATYTAKFQENINKYNVYFKSEDGSVTYDTQNDEYGTPIAYNGTTPTKAADAQYTYTFDCWSTEMNSTGAVVADLGTITGTATYYAHFSKTVNKYDITFLDDDGTLIETQNLEYGATPSIADPVKQNTAEYTYTFTGWSPAITTVTGEKTYTATYSSVKNKYTITFKNGDDVLQSGLVEYGQTPEYTGATPTKESTAQYDYEFVGWTPAVVSVTGEATYSAQFRAVTRSYTITFKTDDGASELGTQTANYGTQIAFAGATPTKTDPTGEWTYEFDGWSETVGGAKVALPTITGPATYYAHFAQTKNQYTATFLIADDETVTSGQTVVDGKVTITADYGTEITAPAVAKTGYNAVPGWLDVNNVAYGETFTLTGNVTLHKAWTIGNYNFKTVITSPTGTAETTTPYDYNATVTVPVPAAIEGYTFGWTDTDEIDISNGWFSMPAKDVTFTGEYTINKYNVTFVDEDNSVLKATTEYNWNTAVVAPDDPTKDATAQYTYTFAGWTDGADTYLTADLPPVTADVTYKATYSSTVNQYTIKFVVDNDDTQYQEYTLDYGATPAYAGTPSRAATAQYTYTFAGWDSEITSVTGDKTYTAQFNSTVNKYTVKFTNPYKATESKEFTLDYGATPVYEGTPTRDRTDEFTYTFTGWDPEVTTVTGDAEYTAQFSETKNKYLVKFVDEDGTVLQSGEVEYGVTPEYTGETPTKDADNTYTYEFSGWTPAITAVTGAATYTAQYSNEFIDYTVTFKFENGAEDDVKTYHYDDEIVVPANPTKAADETYTYEFDKWTPAVSTVCRGNATYTATYKATYIDYTVSFYNYDDSFILSQTYHYGDTPVYGGQTPAKAGNDTYHYDFIGWTPEIAPVTGNASYKAVFDEVYNEYTITFVNWDNSVLSTTDYHWGAAVTVPEDPTRPADNDYTYTFAGWDSEVTAVNGNKTYKATYDSHIIYYTVTFLLDDGETVILTKSDYRYNDTIVVPSTFKQSNAQYTYTFDTWLLDGEPATPDKVTGNLTYVARFTETVNRYTVTFDIKADETVESGETEFTVDYGTEITAPVVTKVGHEFAGWEDTAGADYADTFSVTKDVTLHALWTKGNYNIDYTYTTPSGVVVRRETADYGDSVALFVPDAIEGYTFSGFSTESEDVTVVDGRFTMPAHDVAFSGRFSINTYTVTFLDSVGDVLTTGEYAYGEAVPTPAGPAKDVSVQYHYTFKAWTDGKAEYTSVPAMGAQDTVYAPVYNSIEHTIVETVTKVANCVEKGEISYACTECTYAATEKTAIDSTNHKSVVVDEAVPATCTANGLTEGSHCAACGLTLVAQEVTNKIPHSWNNFWTILREPTCTQEGEKAILCSACGISKSVVSIAKLDHNYNFNAPVSQGNGPGGVYTYTAYKCTTCDKKVVTIDIRAIGADNTALVGATVTVKDYLGRTVATGTTDSNGVWSSTPDYFEDGQYKVTVTHNGKGYSSNGTLTVANGVVSGSITGTATGGAATPSSGGGTCGDLCHRNNFIGHLIRWFYTLISVIFRRTIKHCPDMEWYGSLASKLK